MSKKVNWENVNLSLYKSYSSSLINLIKLTITNLPWGVTSKMVLEALAHSARLAEIKPEKKEKQKNEKIGKKRKKLKVTLKSLKNLKKVLPLGMKKRPLGRIIPELNDPILKLKFLKLVSEKKKNNKMLKYIVSQDLNIVEEKKRQMLFSLMQPGMERKFFSRLQNWKRTKTEFPTEIRVGDEVFQGDRVLSGFSKAAYLQSRNPALEKRKISEHYMNMKSTIRLAEIEAQRSNTVLKPMSRKTFQKILKDVPKNKADKDVYGNCLENILHAPEEVQEVIRSITNEMIQDYKAYSDPMLSISVSSFLYKGKQKARDLTGSYRKISIGLVLTKIADTYLQDTIKTLIRNNQSPLQYGLQKVWTTRCVQFSVKQQQK